MRHYILGAFYQIYVASYRVSLVAANMHTRCASITAPGLHWLSSCPPFSVLPLRCRYNGSTFIHNNSTSCSLGWVKFLLSVPRTRDDFALAKTLCNLTGPQINRTGVQVPVPSFPRPRVVWTVASSFSTVVGQTYVEPRRETRLPSWGALARTSSSFNLDTHFIEFCQHPSLSPDNSLPETSFLYLLLVQVIDPHTESETQTTPRGPRGWAGPGLSGSGSAGRRSP